jgi:two-component system, chemotaxis family, protein-glutamate methylesterase/glutaminase
VEALVELVGSLPPTFPHAILVVLHVSPTGRSMLPAILARACTLPVLSPVDGEPLLDGHVYVAPPDAHLVVEGSELRLSQSPRENGHRPAIDATMRTVSAAYGGDTVGIVLSGARDDGTAGLMAIRAGGGTTIVQDPDEALYPAMPLSALAHLTPDAVLPIRAMAKWILEHVPHNETTDRAAMTAEGNPGHSLPPVAGAQDEPPPSAAGEGTRFTCPDCGGVLFERREGDLERFECSVGHVLSIESLSNAQAQSLENALWAAVRALEDRAAMLLRLAGRARGNDHRRSAESFERRAAQAVDRARTIREAIERTSVDQAMVAES